MGKAEIHAYEYKNMLSKMWQTKKDTRLHDQFIMLEESKKI